MLVLTCYFAFCTLTLAVGSGVVVIRIEPP
jgi:hypothetical protein